jgi:tetratricopeptide (TPR) repeat protein
MTCSKKQSIVIQQEQNNQSIQSEDKDNNIYLDKNIIEDKDLLLILDKDYENKPSYFDNDKKRQDFRKYYMLGLQYYNKKEYELAVNNYILALKIYSLQIPYYQLGLCLLDIDNYENALNAFEKSIEVSYYYDKLTEDLYTFDDNGQKKETYFACYNIACIKSLNNDIDGSFIIYVKHYLKVIPI